MGSKFHLVIDVIILVAVRKHCHSFYSNLMSFKSDKKAVAVYFGKANISLISVDSLQGSSVAQWFSSLASNPRPSPLPGFNHRK